MRRTPPDANVLRYFPCSARRALAVAWLATLFVTPAYAAPFLVKDINDSTKGSDPLHLVEAGGRLYFTAFHQVPPGADGQVWRHDDRGAALLANGDLIGKVGDAVLISYCERGVGCTLSRGDATGASPLASMLPGSPDERVAEVTPSGERVFFTAGDSTGGALWKTDGTAAGTEAVFQFGTDPAFELTASGDALYFVRCGSSSGCELWTSNGTSGGTVPVATVIPGPLKEDDDRSVFALTDVAGTLFFATCERFGECDLWRSDGTADGTEKIVGFDPNNDPDSDDWEPPVLYALGSRLVFNAADDEDDKGLWVTDGTEAETFRLADIDDREPRALVVGARLFFRGVDDGGDELWVTDGTPDGTHRVADLNPGPTGSDLGIRCAGTGGILFVACNAATGCELWASDGTENGTTRLTDILAGPASSAIGECRQASGGRFYFSAGSAAGRELWQSDGTPEGTAQVVDLNPGPGDSDPHEFVTIDGRTFFAACLPSTGCELFETDGTPGGTALLEDLDLRGAGSDPVDFTRAGDFVFFLAQDAVAGRELWRTDGTGPGTIRLTDARFGFEDAFITDLTAIDGGVLFSAERVPWKSDGTLGGTAPLMAIGSPVDCTPSEYTPLGGTIYFRASASTASGPTGCELWKTNGTAAGTSLAADIVEGPDGSFPSRLTRVGETLFFVASDLEHGAELWKSDGTMLGTTLVKDISNDPPSLNSGLDDLTAAGGLLFFTALNYGCGCSNIELWRSDGTEDGTFQVKDINPGNAPSDPALLTDMGGILFFRACEPDTGCQLWRSDGSADGTRLVAEAIPGGTINNLVAVGNRLFFSSRDFLGRDTLWTSDGSSAGTKQLTTFPVTSNVAGFTNVDGRFLFVVADPPIGAEFWTSDGTADGTRRVTNIRERSDPPITELSTATLGGAVFFQAEESKDGRELWAMPLCDADPGGCPNPTTTTTVPSGTTTTTSTVPASTTTTTAPAGSTTTTTLVAITTTTLAPTTTTTTLAPTTTTTEPSPECTSHEQCSSDDPCAEVRCILGQCTTLSAPTFERATCQLSALSGAPTCAAEQSARLDRVVRAKVRKALRLVDHAKDAGTKKATRLVKRARQGLQKIEHRVSKSRKISTKCNAMLVGQIGAQRELLGELTPR